MSDFCNHLPGHSSLTTSTDPWPTEEKKTPATQTVRVCVFRILWLQGFTPPFEGQPPWLTHKQKQGVQRTECRRHTERKKSEKQRAPKKRREQWSAAFVSSDASRHQTLEITPILFSVWFLAFYANRMIPAVNTGETAKNTENKTRKWSWLGDVNMKDSHRGWEVSERGKRKAFVEVRGNLGKSSVLEGNIREGFKAAVS